MSFGLPMLATRRPIAARALAGVLVSVVLGCALGCVSGCVSGCGSSPSGPPACDSARCLAGNSCVDGQCSLLCAHHGDCPEDLGYSCVPGTADDGSGQTLVCRPGSVPRTAGGYGSACGLHLDADCDASQGFVCVGRLNDSDAFCTKLDGCTADADCPQAMYCGTSRQLGCVSPTVCASDGDCALLPGTTCLDNGTGTTSCMSAPGCHLASTDCPRGTTCQALRGQTSRLALARACEPRGYCAPCQTDVDCADAMAACVLDRNGAGFCSQPCQPGGTSCDPGADCQSTPDGNFCVPRGGTCHGDASPCSACRDDSDCGSQGICTLVAETGEQYCIEPCQGTTCPNAPGGEPMACCTDPAGCGLAVNECLPDPFPNTYPRFSTGCWLKPCQVNGDCADGELCDVRSQTVVSDTELVTACGTLGVCRPAHDPSDAIDFPIYQRVCDCAGNDYLYETNLARDRSAAFKGCCRTFAANGNTYTCETPPQ